MTNNNADTILANLPDGVIILDEAGKIVYANPAVERLLDKPADTLIGDNFGFPVSSFGIQEIRIVKQQRLYKIEILVSPMQWQGSDAQLICLRDVTNKRIVEDELQIANEDLQHKASILNELNGRLVQSNDALGQFAHVASHDLKEPLRKIRTFIDLIEKNCQVDLPQLCTGYLNKIDNCAARMNEMIDGVLAYSMLNAFNEPSVPVNLKQVVADVQSDLELVILQKHALISHDGLPTVEGAPVLLHQLFLNLINNALKFSKKDKPPVITVACHEKGPSDHKLVQILISDNGIGFAPDEAAKIFDTFSRLNAKDQYEGTGLGLALCKRIVERHGGTITADGVVMQGAKFQITLPLKQTDAII